MNENDLFCSLKSTEALGKYTNLILKKNKGIENNK